ncbi:MAG TPA: hypothetical protein VGX78_12670 [Pirellulales bacterium]|nr:hypothetical protein [Pirellulales bacterium]
MNALKVLAKHIDALHDAKRAAPWMLYPPLHFTHSETASADARLRSGLRTLERRYPRTDAATIKANRATVLAQIEANAKAQRQWFDHLAADVGKGHDEANDLPTLSPTASAWYEILLELAPHRGMTAPKSLDEIGRRDRRLVVDASTLRGRIKAELVPYGIENKPRIGYRIKPSRRPKQ